MTEFCQYIFRQGAQSSTVYLKFPDLENIITFCDETTSLDVVNAFWLELDQKSPRIDSL